VLVNSVFPTMPLSIGCQSCGTEEETPAHLFLHCCFVQPILQSLKHILRIDREPSDIFYLWTEWMNCSVPSFLHW